MDRRPASIAANPLLIGAVTTLVLVVAIYLSYNANGGLPFVPTYDLKAQLPNATGLIAGNDVRMGGARVGRISKITPYQDPRTGRSIAIAEINLEKKVEPLPANTEVSILSRSLVGLKYLALFRGSSKETFKQGATIPLSHFREPVEIDQFFNMFNKPTRRASQENLISGGNGFAERGPTLNATFHTLRPLVRNLIPVMRNLASPKTGFGELWKDLDKPAEQTAPVAQTNAEGFSELDTFFTAWASVFRSIEASIEGGPPALEQATYSLRFEGPFTEKSAEFMRLLHPSAVALRVAAPAFADAVEEGIRVYPPASTLNERLNTFLSRLRSFSANPVVELALEEITRTAQYGNTVAAGLATAEANCNYVTLFFRNFASLLGQYVGVGTVARVNAIVAPSGANNEGTPSSAPARGPSIDKRESTGLPLEDNYLHANPYPNIATCEAGNEQYEVGKTVIGHAPKAEHNREFTKRSEDIFGEQYGSSTLKDLGIKSAPKGGGKHKGGSG
jgi:phospholipid/cholesterol/gamma-HCH transport system substrate-binding protein